MKIGKYEDVMKDYKKVTCFMDNGKCSGCGNCCSDILPLKNGEIERIKRYIEKNGITESLHGGPNNVQMDLTCPFLTNDNKCSIYKVRPIICRLYRCDRKSEDIARDKYKIVKGMKKTLMRQTFFGKKVEE